MVAHGVAEPPARQLLLNGRDADRQSRLVVGDGAAAVVVGADHARAALLAPDAALPAVGFVVAVRAVLVAVAPLGNGVALVAAGKVVRSVR